MPKAVTSVGHLSGGTLLHESLKPWLETENCVETDAK